MSFKPFPWRNRREAATTPLSRENLNAAEEAEASQVEAQAAAEVVAERKAREEAETLLAPKASPVFTGTPKAPTPAENDNSTTLSTTAYADRAADEAREDAEEKSNTGLGEKLAKAANLSDLASVTTARTNLGLGTAAVANIGFGAGEVMAGTARLDQIAAPTAPIVFGKGTNLSFVQPTPGLGQWLRVQQGTEAEPDTTLNPLVKVSRLLSTPLAEAIVGDGSEQLAGIVGATKGLAATEVQIVGLLGQAQNEGTKKGSRDSPDACAVYGIGRIEGTGIGVGIGGFFRGQTDTVEGQTSGIQAMSYNNSGRTDKAVTNGFPKSSILWLWAQGPNQTAEGVSFANPFGTQVDVGWHFNGQVGKTREDAGCETNKTTTVKDTHITAADVGSAVTGTGIPVNSVILSVEVGVSFTMNNAATTTETVTLKIEQVGPTITADLLSDSTAKTGILIRGTHSTAALAIAEGSGSVVLGGTTLQEAGTAILEVRSTTPRRPLALFGTTNTAANYGIFIQNSSGGAEQFVVANENGILTGTKPGDTGTRPFTTNGFYHIGGSISVIKVGQANTLAFFNGTAVAQQKTTGTTVGVTLTGATITEQLEKSTFTGSTGATKYTLSDIVLALKNYSLLAA